MTDPREERAFPIVIDLGINAEFHKGMTLRDYFAIRATEQDIVRHMGQDTSRAEARYRFADDMIRARRAK